MFNLLALYLKINNIPNLWHHRQQNIDYKYHTSIYKFERPTFLTGRRIAPKFGTHVPIDALT